MIKITWNSDDLLESRWPYKLQSSEDNINHVSSIINEVKKRGDEALVDFAKKYDDVDLNVDELEVTRGEILDAYTLVPVEQVEALKVASKRLTLIEQKRMRGLSFKTSIEGVKIACSVRALRRVGCYVPGGQAAYPSTVIMNVIPAKVAGVKEVFITTPTRRNGLIPPLTLVAADISGVDRVFRIGGAHAIAALAYGTKSIPRVDKIVGPGNKYVTAAKAVVSRDVAIDMQAGPTEITIIADDSADPRFVALDLVSQAEHGPGGLCVLVTDSEKLAHNVQSFLNDYVPTIPRSAEVSNVLQLGGFALIVKDMEAAGSFVDDFAPEHVEIQTRYPESLADKVTSSGLVLLGPYTPASSTDYCMGVNHVLPTGGYGKIRGGITVLDYLKPVNIVYATKAGLEQVSRTVQVISEAEGLQNHGAAVKARFFK
ncbi:MAG: histidinol dehydrogenase [Candidatus Bathyarchaeota archaeon]|nr:histidinol dehydrogenase [Candidatus Bathyarchaeota archaeon]